MRLTALSGREESALREAIRGVLKEVWTALPSSITKDSDGHTATHQSTVKQIITFPDGSTTTVPFPDFDTSPVHYPGGGGVTATHPVKKDDEGVSLFLSMPQDLWHDKGGVQDPVDGRRHHLSDSRWIPGGRSNPRKLNPPPSTSSGQDRSDDGNHVRDYHPQNGLSSVSTKKHLTQVGGSGSGGAGTLHLPGKILKNAAKVLINCIKQDPLPPPGDSFANRKQIATKSIGAGAGGAGGGGIASIMSSLMGGGASSMFASPIAAAGGALSGAITSAVSALGGVSGAGGLMSALSGSGGLSDALSGLMGGVSALSGVTAAGVGGFGLTDLLSHAQSLSQFFGSSTAPSSVSLSTVLAPLQSGSTLSGLTSSLTTLSASVVAGATTPTAATATVNSWTAQIAALMTNSSAAISTMNDAAPLLNTALAIAGAGAGLDANEQAIAAAISTPQLAALTAAINSIFALSDTDAASAQAFPDADATQPGATGGM
jgi:hypothetical protein